VLLLKRTTDISKAVWRMKFVTLDRTTSAWFRDVVQTEGVIIQYCFVLSGISVTAEWQ